MYTASEVKQPRIDKNEDRKEWIPNDDSFYSLLVFTRGSTILHGLISLVCEFMFLSSVDLLLSFMNSFMIYFF